MADFDFDAITPQPTEIVRTPRGRAAQDTGPNPFLDKGWLMESYQTGEGRQVVVPGGIEEYRPVVREHLHTWAELNGYVSENGKLKDGARQAYLEAHNGQGEGDVKTRPTGVGAQVVKWIRDAANKLEIGATIQWETAKRGHVAIKYLGQDRKHKRSEDDE